MRQTKRRIEFFSFFDLAGIAAHLERQAARGWMLERCSQLFWRYRRTEPQQCTFAVCCFPKGSEYDPEPPENQRDYYDLCAHTGWELTASFAWMQIFRTTRPAPVPIETDPALALETLHRATRRNRVSYLAVLVIWLPVFLLQVGRAVSDPAGFFASSTDLFSAALSFFLLLLCLTELGGYYLWRRRARRATAQGGPLPDARWNTLLQRVLLALDLGILVLELISLASQGNALPVLFSVMSFGYMFGLITLVNAVRNLLRRRGTPRTRNAVLTTLASFLLAFVLWGGITYAAVQAVSHGVLASAPTDPPLSLSALSGETPEEERTRSSSSASPLLARLEFFSYDAGQPTLWLDYCVYTVRLSALYELCWDDLASGLLDEPVAESGTLIAADAAPWGAQQAMRLYDVNGEETNTYLLRYQTRAVLLRAGWPLTAAQMAQAGQALGGG